jgi:hypothetical protein
VVRTLLIRGMLAGLLAGMLVFGFGKVFERPKAFTSSKSRNS